MKNALAAMTTTELAIRLVELESQQSPSLNQIRMARAIRRELAKR